MIIDYFIRITCKKTTCGRQLCGIIAISGDSEFALIVILFGRAIQLSKWMEQAKCVLLTTGLQVYEFISHEFMDFFLIATNEILVINV